MAREACLRILLEDRTPVRDGLDTAALLAPGTVLSYFSPAVRKASNR
jgi:hypothetical protein